MVPYNVDGPYQMRKAVRQNFAHTVDFIKLYGTGSMMSKGSNPGQPIMDDDEMLEAVKLANQAGTYCAIHCHSAEAIEQAIRCGVATIEHASFIAPDLWTSWPDGPIPAWCPLCPSPWI